MIKLKSISLCSSATGQLALEIMVNPPLEGVAPETKEKYLSESKALLNSMKERACIVTKYLNSMKNIHAQEV